MSQDTTRLTGREDPEAFYRRLKPPGMRLMLSIDGGGAKGYMTLHCLAKLEELDLKQNPGITDAGLGHLEKLTQLKKLHLTMTGVTDEGIEKLKQALPDCQIVR